MNARAMLAIALGISEEEAESAVRGVTKEWDSLHHVELMFLLEEATGRLPDSDELAQITDLASLSNFIQRI